MPQEDELVDYTGAAGHEGLSTVEDEAVIIKPCTQAEIDFYEAIQEDDRHEGFRAHMPVYMGALSLNPNPDIQAAAARLAEGEGVISPDVAQSLVQNINGREPRQASAHALPPQTDWVPSGGKRLNTGLALVLENAAYGFNSPNVLDLKLGARLWDDDAPPAKRQKLDQVASETTSTSLGFRVAGMKLSILDGKRDTLSSDTAAKALENVEGQQTAKHVIVEDGFQRFDKFYGRELTQQNVKSAFIRFLGGSIQNLNGDVDTANQKLNQTTKMRFARKYAVILLDRLLRELQSIRFVLENEESRMYSASILVVVEASDTALETALDSEAARQNQNIVHSSPRNGTHHELNNDTHEPQVKEGRGHTSEDDKNTHHGEEKAKVEEGNNDVNEDEDYDDEGEEEEEEETPKVIEVRLIDFAHARFVPGEGPDENVLHGVRSIAKIVEELLEECRE